MMRWASRTAAVLLLGIGCWGAGALTYRLALKALFGEEPSRQDWQAVMFWSAAAYGVSLVFFILPVLLWLNVERRHRLVTSTLVALACGTVTAIALAGVFGSRQTFSSEMLLFAALFCSASATFGLGYGIVLRWSDVGSQRLR